MYYTGMQIPIPTSCTGNQVGIIYSLNCPDLNILTMSVHAGALLIICLEGITPFQADNKHSYHPNNVSGLPQWRLLWQCARNMCTWVHVWHVYRSLLYILHHEAFPVKTKSLSAYCLCIYLNGDPDLEFTMAAAQNTGEATFHCMVWPSQSYDVLDKVYVYSVLPWWYRHPSISISNICYPPRSSVYCQVWSTGHSHWPGVVHSCCLAEGTLQEGGGKLLWASLQEKPTRGYKGTGPLPIAIRPEGPLPTCTEEVGRDGRRRQGH